MEKFNYPAINGQCTMLCPVYPNDEIYVGAAYCVIKCLRYKQYDERTKTITCRCLNKKLKENANKTL